MVTGTKMEVGGTQNLSAGVRKTIQSIKEIVGDHSDADIYVALKETNMDPNETAQNLLNQDPFHEVKRRRDKKKELPNAGYSNFTASEGSKNYEQAGQRMKLNSYSDQNVRNSGYTRNASTASEPWKPYEPGQGIKFNSYSRPHVRRRGYTPNASTGVSHEFRIVRDNRDNQYKDTKLALGSVSTSEPVILNATEKSSSAGAFSTQKAPIGRLSSQKLDGPSNLQSSISRYANSIGTSRKDVADGKLSSVLNADSKMQNLKANDSHLHSRTSSNNSAIGVYSSSSDPVHVPSRSSRSAANIGAIKREVGVVGARRQSTDSAKLSSSESSSFSNQSQNLTPESAVPALSAGRSFSSNQYSSRPHQSVGHQKAPQQSKEWKPKLSQKTASNAVGVIGIPAKAASPSSDNSKNLESDVLQLQDKLTRINIIENQNVILAPHIRVSESDRCRLTFGSFEAEFETEGSGFQGVVVAEVPNTKPSGGVSVSAPESSSDEPSSVKQPNLTDDRIRNSESSSPASVPVPENQLTEKKDSSNPQHLDSYADIGLIRNNNLSYTPSEPQQQQDASELSSFPAYTQTGYDMPYYRPVADETVQGQGLLSPHEALSPHTQNSIPVTTIALGQQHQQLAQMYPQLHVSPFANIMPYRPIINSMYVPSMAMPGYSGNPAYAHPSNGSSYLLMPGGSSHLTAGNLKYGLQQFKSVPTASPTGYGNFTSPTGYAINGPGFVSGGLEDTSRLRFKDGSFYAPNPQAETSEIYMNPRDIPSMHSASYYNMPGQSPHAGYLSPHSGHASFGAAAAAAAQSSHMQFQGLYHPPPQPGAVTSHHHLGAAMGGNVGVAAASPRPQVGAYQQAQLGHLNWSGNF